MEAADSQFAETDSYDADEWGQYRSLSTLAVIAFALGLCSVVMFASPLLMIVPLAAAMAAVLALRGIAASEGSLSGASLARWGLALAIMFCIAASARVKVREVLLRGQADRVAREWLALAAESRTQAMLDLMTQDARGKLMPAVEPGQPMPFFGGILASALVRQDPLVVSLGEIGTTELKNSSIKDSNVLFEANPPQVFLKYLIGSKQSKQMSCAISLKRYRASQDAYVWLVDSWTTE